ncbi:hypothetical protein CASFOL_021828 [Castilleja foliolosa]|uniref:Response regulatory domain-containing protein n=1 Tax=Castilleja foliolosa TaxID=1961234 RepID=A0ABD3D0D9_9LAMI
MALVSSAIADNNSNNVEEEHIFHVLAVDDSNIDRKLLERLLTVSSYQVTCVESGDKALEFLGLLEYETSKSSQQEVSKVNLIMTDYSMPGISGYDLLKRIKDSSWKDVPVVVMSSENVPSRINMCLEGGAEEFLLKPVKLSDLSKLQSHILKYTISHDDPNCRDEHHEITSDYGKTTTNDVINIDKNEKMTTNDVISIDENQKTTTNDVISMDENGKTTTNDVISIDENEKSTINDVISINENEKTTISDVINSDENESDKNCSNCNKRKATLATISSDLSRPRVKELSVS